MALIFIVGSILLELTADISCAVQSSQVLSTTHNEDKRVLVPCVLFYNQIILALDIFTSHLVRLPN
jgi:hypothetical protein